MTASAAFPTATQSFSCISCTSPTHLMLQRFVPSSVLASLRAPPQASPDHHSCPVTSDPSDPNSHLPAQPWAYPRQTGTRMGDYSTLPCHIWFPSKAGHKATRIKRWGDEVWMWGSAHAQSELVKSIFLGLCLRRSSVITLRLLPRS